MSHERIEQLARAADTCRMNARGSRADTNVAVLAVSYELAALRVLLEERLPVPVDVHATGVATDAAGNEQ